MPGLAAIIAAKTFVAIAVAVAQSRLMLTSFCSRWAALSALFLLSALAVADPILDTAESYARTQSQGLPGTVSIQVGALDPHTQLPACNALQGYTPPSARPWGRTHVGVRCLGPTIWTILVPVQITVIGNYVVTARPVAAGHSLQADDLALREGDISALPIGVVTDLKTAIGKNLKNSLSAGQPLRSDLLLAALLVRQGQSVKLLFRGEGFTASSEGKALNNGAAGQLIQVKVASGQTLSGVVQTDGSIEVGK